MNATAINQTAISDREQNGRARAEGILDCAFGINTLALALQRLSERRRALRAAETEMYGGEASLLEVRKEIASAIRELASCVDATVEANCEELFAAYGARDDEDEGNRLSPAAARTWPQSPHRP